MEKEQSLENSFKGGEKFHSSHRGQLIVHGPVIYSENPYELDFEHIFPRGTDDPPNIRKRYQVHTSTGIPFRDMD